MSRRDFWAGLFVLAAGTLLLGAYLFSSLRHFTRNTTHYIVEAREISGVSEGTEVVMGGYSLGRVRKVTIITGPPLRFELEVALRKEVPIPAGTKVLIASKSLGGSRVLEFVPPEKPGPELPEGSRLSAVPEADLQQIYNTAMDALVDFKSITADLRKIVSSDAGGEGVSGALHRLNKVLTDADATVRSANETFHSANDTVKNLNQTITILRPQLEGTMRNTEQATAHLNEMLAKDGSVEKLLRTATALVNEMKPLITMLEGYDPKKNPEIRETLHHANITMKNMEALTNELKRHPWAMIRKGKDVVQPPESAPDSVPAAASAPGSAPVAKPAAP